MKYLILLTLLVSCSQGPVGKCFQFDFYGSKIKVKVDKVIEDKIVVHFMNDYYETGFKLMLEDLKSMEEISCK